MKKTQTRDNFNENKHHLVISDYSWLDGIVNYGNTIIIAVLGVIFLGFLYFRFFPSASQGAPADYIRAEKDYISLKKSASSPEDAKTQSALLDDLNAIFAKRPELKTKYEGAIAQILINNGKWDQATPLMNQTLKRTQAPYLAFYEAYAHTTQLIGNKDYAQALAKAKELKKQLSDARSNKPDNFGNELYGFNLLRIAVLAGETGNKNEEADAWNELAQTSNGVSYLNAIQLPFVEGKFGLADYIKATKG